MIRLHAVLCVPGLVAVFLIGAIERASAQDPFQAAANSAGRNEEPKSSAAKPSPSTPKEPERIVKTNEEWARQLTHEQFVVTRMKGTEPAFSGKYSSGHFRGTFVCVCCGAKLFEARHKFESGTGWPSFWRTINDKAVETAWDYSEPSEARVEVNCRRCGAHLGHVFQDGPPPTGLRYCMNSVALKLDTEKPTSAPTRKTTRTQAAKTTSKTRSSSGSRVTRTPATKSNDLAPKSQSDDM
jgi:peptide-methionine (R)-S-oxide reductase